MPQLQWRFSQIHFLRLTQFMHATLHMKCTTIASVYNSLTCTYWWWWCYDLWATILHVKV